MKIFTGVHKLNYLQSPSETFLQKESYATVTYYLWIWQQKRNGFLWIVPISNILAQYSINKFVPLSRSAPHFLMLDMISLNYKHKATLSEYIKTLEILITLLTRDNSYQESITEITPQREKTLCTKIITV